MELCRKDNTPTGGKARMSNRPGLACRRERHFVFGDGVDSFSVHVMCGRSQTSGKNIFLLYGPVLGELVVAA